MTFQEWMNLPSMNQQRQLRRQFVRDCFGPDMEWVIITEKHQERITWYETCERDGGQAMIKPIQNPPTFADWSEAIYPDWAVHDPQPVYWGKTYITRYEGQLYLINSVGTVNRVIPYPEDNAFEAHHLGLVELPVDWGYVLTHLPEVLMEVVL